MDDLDLGATVRGFAPGQKVFSRYVLRRLLGRGGMGVVWLARDEELEREVALKFLPEVVTADREAVRDLKRETRRSLELTHPHIIRIYDFVQDARAVAISMEYVAGDTLAARKLDRPEGHFEVAELREWTTQLLEALEYAHARAQVVHRDLKPANLMVDAKGFLKVADFGIAASVSDSVSRVSAQAGSSGTPLYMSPQQMMGEKPAVTDDMYAVGATLYELLTGKPPFHAGNIIAQVQGKVPPSLAERRRELERSGAPIPLEWESAIASCLAKDPQDRPRSASSLAHALGLAVAGPVAPRLASPPPVVPPPDGIAARAAAPDLPSRKRSPRLLVSAGLALVLGLGAAVLGVKYFRARAAEQVAQAEAAARAREETARDWIARVNALPAHLPAEEFAALVRQAEDFDGGEAYRQRLATVVQDQRLARSEYEQRQLQMVTTLRERIRALPALATDAQLADVERAVGLATAERETLARDFAARRDEILRAREDARRGGIIVRVTPAGAEVQVGAVAVERAPATIKDLRPGRYPVRVRLEGHDDWAGEVDVKPDAFADLNVTLARSLGRVTITGSAGAEVYAGSQRIGSLPLSLEQVPVGPVSYEVRAPRHQPRKLQGVVARGETLALTAELERIQPRREEGFENTLGMRFLPLRGNVLLSQWETRVSDYRAFVRETGHRTAVGAQVYSLRQGNWANHGHTWDNVGFSRQDNHPVTCVTAADAEAFCRWLTEKERRSGDLRPDQSYRLPTPEEWMEACRRRDGSMPRYPWGDTWPPPRDAGNLAGEEARTSDWPHWDVIPGRNDGFAQSAPVGSYRANDRGFQDLGGNVGELLRAPDGSIRCHGFGWAVAQPERLTTVNFEAMSTAVSITIGFRAVLVTGER